MPAAPVETASAGDGYASAAGAPAPPVAPALPASMTREGLRGAAGQNLVASAVLLILALSAWSILKGAMRGFHGSELYFWVTTYGGGFVRRGLIGTALWPVLHHADLLQVKRVVLAINRAGLGLMVLMLVLSVTRQATQAKPVALAASVLAASTFLGQTAFLVGFPDGLLAILLAALTIAAWKGRPALVVGLALFGALAHDFVPIAAFPGLCLAALLRRDLGAHGRITLLAAGCVAVLLVWAAGRPAAAAVDALAQRMTALGDSPATAFYQANWRLTQGVADSLARVSSEWRLYWLNGLLGLVYAATPAMVLVWLGWPRLRAAQPGGGPRWRRILVAGLYLGACFSPLAILLIAIDLSRLAGFTALTAYLTLLFLPPAPLPRGAPWVAGATIAGYLLLPVYSLHLPYASAAHLRLLAPVCAPCSNVFVDALDFYNRNKPPAERRAIIENPVYENAPGQAW